LRLLCISGLKFKMISYIEKIRQNCRCNLSSVPVVPNLECSKHGIAAKFPPEGGGWLDVRKGREGFIRLKSRRRNPFLHLPQGRNRRMELMNADKKQIIIFIIAHARRFLNCFEHSRFQTHHYTFIQKEGKKLLY